MSGDGEALAVKALSFVPDSGRIGLGTGHTIEPFLQALAERIRQGMQVRGVPTSEATAQRARSLGIPLDTLDDAEPLAVTVDGADEVEQHTLHLIKGWGGALVRERIVAAASRQQIILITGEKIVDRLGSRGRLPIEILPFAMPFCRRRLEQLPLPGGLKPSLRLHDQRPFVSDNGNWILDCILQPLNNPIALHNLLRTIPGVVDTGLFLDTATVVLVAREGQVEEWRQNDPR